MVKSSYMLKNLIFELMLQALSKFFVYDDDDDVEELYKRRPD